MDSFPVIIVTGLSGSGKSTALKVFEDMGFFAVDGLPAVLAIQMAQMVSKASLGYKGLAIGMDVRQTAFITDYEKSFETLRENNLPPRVLFFEAKTPVLMQRYAVTRRPHPLEKEGLGLEQALELERSRLKRLRKMADMVLDTSTYSVHDLRRMLQKKWEALRHAAQSLRIHVISFGFKYGTPSEADMVFDLRFMSNPYFIPELKPLSGQDAQVAAYVLESKAGSEFFARFSEFLQYIIHQFEAEGRFRMTIAIGCTGGRHRSVAVSEAIAKKLGKKGYPLSLEHRHLELG